MPRCTTSARQRHRKRLSHQVACLGPAAAWPEGFTLFSMMGMVDPSGEARVDAAYPAWRRATRLSFAAADVLAQIYEAPEQEPSLSAAEVLQELLEAVSTSDRLRLALRRMRDVRQHLRLS